MKIEFLLEYLAAWCRVVLDTGGQEGCGVLDYGFVSPE